MNVVEIITSVAQQYGLDPLTAVATAYQESKLNPAAVGDNGTSFGLYQLHKGGELGIHSPQWAFDPRNNADTAIREMAAVAKAHPTWTPGQIAAAAQRPANRNAYAASVDSIYRRIKTGALNVSDAATATVTADVVNADSDPVTGLFDGLASAYQSIFGADRAIRDLHTGQGSTSEGVMTAVGSVIAKIVNVVSLPNLGMRVFAGTTGAIFLVMGVYFYASESK